jgi:uncharacterized protein
MSDDPLSVWMNFLVSTAAPKNAMVPMELDGFLTGVIVSPDLLLPSDWLDAIWGEDDPAFDDEANAETVIGAVMAHYNAIIAALDAGFAQLEAKQPITAFRPLFLTEPDKPQHSVVRLWARGFGKAMRLSPDGWCSIAEDERLLPVLSPFTGFLENNDPAFVPADNIDELLDEAAADIPRATVLLRKISQFTQQNRKGRRSTKFRRNDPCPCGSGRKFKRCCGANPVNLN